MGMDNRKTSGGSFVAALVFFVMTASIAIFLLLTALVVWLSEVTGSFILSSLIVGGFFAVLAAVIYLLAIREGVERIRDRSKRSTTWHVPQRRGTSGSQTSFYCL